MVSKISVVINTLNSESTLKRAIDSVNWADEIIICDMHSTDKTVELAKRLGAKIFFHKQIDFVEPARNFAISKASNKWILILDPDEQITVSLGQRLQEIAEKMKEIDYVRLPRKNFIFGKWMRASMWWPDYNIRFFQKGRVVWTDKIHRPPRVLGSGLDLAPEDKWAIIHYHYDSVAQFMERMLRYTKIQADEIIADGYRFDWKDAVKKPLGEFLGRYFANRGFEDGLHGFVLSILQAFSFFLVYLRIWELEGFSAKELKLEDIKKINTESRAEIDYWFKHVFDPGNNFKILFQKIKNKL